MAISYFLLSHTWRRSTRFRPSLRGFRLLRNSHLDQASQTTQVVSSRPRKNSCLSDFGANLSRQRWAKLMRASAEASVWFTRTEEREFCFRRCPMARRYSRVLSSLEDSQESVIRKSINQTAFVSEIVNRPENETEHIATRRKFSISRHQNEVSANAMGSLSFAVAKDHYEDPQAVNETSESVSDFVASDPNMKPLTLESLGFTDDGVEIERSRADSHRRQRTTAPARKQERISSKIGSDDAPSNVVTFGVIAQPVCASPEKMKQVALEASSILAEAAGIKTFFKKATAKKVSSNGDNVEQHFIKIREDEPHVSVNEVVTNVPLKAGLDEAEKLWCHHPWPEWVAFLKFLHTNKFFDGFEQWVDDGKSIFETYSLVRHATVGFGRDRNDIFRSLTRKDLRVLASFGCPDTERKASNASKRLRAHFDIFEGEVCVRCKFKMSCPRAFLKPPIKVPVGTLDVVRVLTGFAGNASPDAESFTSYPEEVKVSACNLLKEILIFGAMPRDPTFPKDIPTEPEPPVQKTFVESNPRRRVAFTAPEKPGDWVCPNCEYMNFARNKVCLECRVFRPRQEQEILLGDWECSKCRFLNFSKNLVCRECKTKRPTRVQWTGGERLPENFNMETSKGGRNNGKSLSSRTWKPNLTKREVTMRRDGEQDYEASDEDADNTYMNSMESCDTESEVDLSDEEDEALSQSPSKTRGRVKSASFSGIEDKKRNNKARSWSQSNNGFMGSKTSPKSTGKEGQKPRTGASMPSRGKTGKSLFKDTDSDSESFNHSVVMGKSGKPKAAQSSFTNRRKGRAAGSASFDSSEDESFTLASSARGKTEKSLFNDTDSDSESFSCSRAEVKSGKPKATKSSFTNRRKGEAASSSSFASSEDESSTLANSATTMGSKPLFNWSDSESDESDGGSKKLTKGKPMRKEQTKKNKSDRRADGNGSKTFIHQPQKSGSGAKGRKSKR